MAKKALSKAEVILEAVCPKCRHRRSVQAVPDHRGIVRCTHCSRDFDPGITLKKVEVGFLGGAEQGIATGNLIQNWRRRDKPEPTPVPQPVRQVWNGSKADFVRKVVREMPREDWFDSRKRGHAFKVAIRHWRPKDGMMDFTVHDLHQTFRQIFELHKPKRKRKRTLADALKVHPSKH